jgi:hypothetical protein
MLRLQELLDREAGGVREDLRDEAVGELGGGAGDLRRRRDLRRLSQQQQRLRQRVHGLRLRRCGCVAAAATSVLPATSSVLAVPPSQPPSFRQKSSIVSLLLFRAHHPQIHLPPSCSLFAVRFPQIRLPPYVPVCVRRPSPYPAVTFRQFTHADPVDPHAAAAGEDVVWCVPLVKIVAARIHIFSTPLHCRGMGDGPVLWSAATGQYLFHFIYY